MIPDADASCTRAYSPAPVAPLRPLGPCVGLIRGAGKFPCLDGGGREAEQGGSDGSSYRRARLVGA